MEATSWKKMDFGTNKEFFIDFSSSYQIRVTREVIASDSKIMGWGPSFSHSVRIIWLPFVSQTLFKFHCDPGNE